MVADFALQNVNSAIEVNYDFGGTLYSFPPAVTLTNTNGITSSNRREFKFYFLFLIISNAPLYPVFIRLT